MAVTQQGHATRWLAVSLATAVTVALAPAGSSWAAGPTPVQGPATGGTTVTVTPTPGAGYTSISAGDIAAYALNPDGTACAWGSDDDGELGDGSNSHVPLATVKMPAGVRFSQVDGGGAFGLALGTNGHAYAWGLNTYGELGDGTTLEKDAPVAVTMPAGVTFTQVAAGDHFSAALGSDGKVYTWGADGGPGVQHLTPQAVTTPAGVTKFTSIAAGVASSFAFGSDGKLYGWGWNGSGQLGDGTTTTRWTTPAPVSVPEGVTFTQVSAGLNHAAALASDGQAYAWGSNGTYGSLGIGNTTTTELTPTPVAMPAGVTFTRISAGGTFSLALGSDGRAYSWGANNTGQLGYAASTANQFAPVQVTQAWKVGAVTFGGVPGTGLTDNTDGTWTVTTPAHAAGTVDVVVTTICSTCGSSSVTTYPKAFTYTAPPTITTPSLSAPTQGAAYSQTVVATGSGPITFSVSAGALPKGLSLAAASGLISGVPSVTGSATFTIRAENAWGSAVRTYTLTVAKPKAFSRTYAPTVSGTAKVGKTLTAKVKTWSPTATFTYRWLRNGSAISGATKSTYKLHTADRGRKISVKVVGSRTGYSPVARTSKARKVS